MYKPKVSRRRHKSSDHPDFPERTRVEEESPDPSVVLPNYKGYLKRNLEYWSAQTFLIARHNRSFRCPISGYLGSYGDFLCLLPRQGSHWPYGKLDLGVVPPPSEVWSEGSPSWFIVQATQNEHLQSLLDKSICCNTVGHYEFLSCYFTKIAVLVLSQLLRKYK